MHVPINVDDHWHRWRRGYVAMAFLWFFASAASAVDFDENLKAPRVRNPAELRGQAQSYAARFAEQHAAAPEASITNQALFRERFDLAWQIQQAIDAREPLGDLSAIGLESADDGAYRMNFAKAPQWMRVDRLLAGVLPQANWEILGSQLMARGFRTEDVAALRHYVESHDAFAAARQKALPVSVSFSRLVKKFDKLKVPVTNDVVFSYVYQRNKAHDEALREWTQGLFAALDAQRTRILVSYYLESPGFGLWAPSDMEAGIADILATARLPNFEKLATDEAKGITP